MAIVNDPGQDLLGGNDIPDAPIDPNAPQIRVSQRILQYFENVYQNYLYPFDTLFTCHILS